MVGNEGFGSQQTSRTPHRCRQGVQAGERWSSRGELGHGVPWLQTLKGFCYSWDKGKASQGAACVCDLASVVLPPLAPSISSILSLPQRPQGLYTSGCFLHPEYSSLPTSAQGLLFLSQILTVTSSRMLSPDSRDQGESVIPPSPGTFLLSTCLGWKCTCTCVSVSHLSLAVC